MTVVAVRHTLTISLRPQEQSPISIKKLINIFAGDAVSPVIEIAYNAQQMYKDANKAFDISRTLAQEFDVGQAVPVIDITEAIKQIHDDPSQALSVARKLSEKYETRAVPVIDIAEASSKIYADPSKGPIIAKELATKYDVDVGPTLDIAIAAQQIHVDPSQAETVVSALGRSYDIDVAAAIEAAKSMSSDPKGTAENMLEALAPMIKAKTGVPVMKVIEVAKLIIAGAEMSPDERKEMAKMIAIEAAKRVAEKAGLDRESVDTAIKIAVALEAEADPLSAGGMEKKKLAVAAGELIAREAAKGFAAKTGVDLAGVVDAAFKADLDEEEAAKKVALNIAKVVALHTNPDLMKIMEIAEAVQTGDKAKALSLAAAQVAKMAADALGADIPDAIGKFGMTSDGKKFSVKGQVDMEINGFKASGEIVVLACMRSHLPSCP